MKDRECVTTNGRAVFYAAMWDDLRQAAMNKGWALGLHGSLASDMEGFDLDICEIDKEYFDNGLKAFQNHKLQHKLL